MTLHATVYGSSGPPLLVLHGLFGMSDNWHSIARRLEDRRTVHALDLRNHGRSPSSNEVTYRLMSQDVLAYMDEHGLQRADVLGHSMGGKASMELALSEPARVSRLIIVDVALRAYEPRHLHIFRAFETVPLNSFHSRKEVEDGMMQVLGDITTVHFLLKNVGRADDGTYRWKLDHRSLRANYDNINAAIASTGTFGGPAMLVRGATSSYVSDADISALRARLPDLTVRTIEGAGHWVHADQPDRFVQCVASFLS